jgi:hypothetical protein
MTSIAIPTNRVYAELPSGELVVPGETCAGPDTYGMCPMAQNGVELPCAGATWHYAGEQGWTFAFNAENADGICPMTVLDPLGPLPVPGD